MPANRLRRDITGVERLTLKTLYDPHRQGNGGRAHVVWLEPYVSTAAPDLGLTKAFESDKFKESSEREQLVNRASQLLYSDNFAELGQVGERNSGEARHSRWLASNALVLRRPDKAGVVRRARTAVVTWASDEVA